MLVTKPEGRTLLGIGKVPLPNGGTAGAAGAAGAAGELGTATGTVVKVGAWLLTSGVLTTALSFAGTLTGVGVAVYTSTVSLNGLKQETFGVHTTVTISFWITVTVAAGAQAPRPLPDWLFPLLPDWLDPDWLLSDWLPSDRPLPDRPLAALVVTG